MKRAYFFTLLFCFLLPIWLFSQTQYLYYAQYGTYTGLNGNALGQLSGALGVCIDSSGKIYVTEGEYNNRLDVLTMNGTNIGPYALFGSYGYGNGQFNLMISVAIDNNNRIYVADTDNNRIQVLTIDGTNIGYYTQFGLGNLAPSSAFSPVGVAVDSLDKIYLTGDFSLFPGQPNSALLVLTMDGTNIGSYTQFVSVIGTVPGAFNGLGGIAVDNKGKIYMADGGNHRIQVLSMSGTNIGSYALFGSPGTGDGQFEYPNYLAVDGTGKIFVTDYGNNRIQVLTMSGTNIGYYTQFGSSGSGDGQLNYPYGITVDGSGKVYVADTRNSRVEVFAPCDLVIASQPISQTICGANMAFLSVSVTGIAPFRYAWSNGDTLQSIIVTSSGLYTVTVSSYCGWLQSLPATILLASVSGITSADSICRGQTVTLSGSGAMEYFWSGGVVNGQGFLPSRTSTYTLVGITLAGCSDTALVTVTVFQTPTVTGTAMPDTVCFGMTATLSGIGALSYIWDAGVKDGQGFVPQSSYAYKVIGVGLGGCTDSSSVLLNVQPIPRVIGMATPNPACSGYPVTLSGFGALKYDWENGIINGTSYTAFNSAIFIMTGTGLGGCTDTATVNLVVDPHLDISLGKDTSISCHEPITIGNKTNIKYREYLWGNGSTSQTITVNIPGTYWLSISDACGTAADTIMVSLKKVYVPNVFTPNGDGKNEEMIFGNYFSNGNLSISNRWGYAVFQSNNYPNDWKAENVPDGIYFYQLNTGCEEVKGWVEVIR